MLPLEKVGLREYSAQVVIMGYSYSFYSNSGQNQTLLEIVTGALETFTISDSARFCLSIV